MTRAGSGQSSHMAAEAMRRRAGPSSVAGRLTRVSSDASTATRRSDSVDAMAGTGRAPKPTLQSAVDHALGGDWQKAHVMVQDYEDDPTAAWIHAVVHRM